MVWSNPPIQYEIILPSSAVVGAPGSVYIGGPHLPAELVAQGFDFAVVWYAEPPDTNKYYFYAFTGSNAGAAWVEGVVTSTGTVIFNRSVTSDGSAMSFSVLGQQYMTIAKTSTGFEWRVDTFDQAAANRGLLDYNVDSTTFIGTHRIKQFNGALTTIAQLGTDLDAVNNLSKLFLEARSGGVGLPRRATWHDNGSATWLNDDDPAIDTVVDISGAAQFAAGTAIGATTIASAVVQYNVSYDRIVTLVMRLNCAGNIATPVNTSFVGALPASILNTNLNNTLFIPASGAYGSGVNLLPIGVLINPNTGQITVRHSGVAPATSTTLYCSATWPAVKPT